MDNIKRAMQVSGDIAGIVMAEALMDETVNTYDMFEDLAWVYLDSPKPYQEGMDRAVTMLTNMSISELADLILQREKEAADCE